MVRRKTRREVAPHLAVDADTGMIVAQILTDQNTDDPSQVGPLLAYIRERRVGLSVYLNDSEVLIDTNHLERALRVIPMGRKNWLFSWTELGAKHVGIVQSLLATCRLLDINPYDYFVDVLQRVSQHPASLIDQLTPRIWKQTFAFNILRSDLHELVDWRAHASE